MRGMDRLLELQEIDTAIDRARARRSALESGGEEAAARAEADAAEVAFGELRLKSDEIGRSQQKLEHEIDSLTQKAAAEERRLYDGSIANVKELESIRHEIDNLKRRRGDREDELLVLMEEREGIDGRAAETEKRASELRTRVDDVAERSGGELEEIDRELASRAAAREALVPAIDPDLLELYDDLRGQKKGIGAAALVDGVCQGCHEKLSAMELDKLKRIDGVKRCEYCRRIVIFT
jgi:predicted  nucleic acid-binding Zn-ribbon protein